MYSSYSYRDPGPSYQYQHQRQGEEIRSYGYSPERVVGIPTTGIYAQDGIWEDDELSSEATTIRPSSGSTFGHTSTTRNSVKTESAQGRSRSGTIGSVKEEKPWGWNRKPSPVLEQPETVIPLPPVPTKAMESKTLEKKKSKSMLRGKGRRGELSVQVEVSPSKVPSIINDPIITITITSPSPSPSSSSNIQPIPTQPQQHQPVKQQSTWRKGMQKLFKSKSAVGLREAFSSVDPNRPPLPTKPVHVNLKPLSPPLSGKPFALPADPFASSLNMSSNTIPSPITPLSPKPLNRNSPSLRDLKQFLAPGKLTKAKSLANLRSQPPASAPPTQTTFREISDLPRPKLHRLPTESPPLLPPNPPYFPLISSAPTSPLPALPSSPISPNTPTTPNPPGVPKSSSAVLLPRSRSTSMSLKSPPTSSSFFDLYEQLGIWPTPTDKSPGKSAEVKLEPELVESPSATFSTDSWNAAIAAFPLVDDLPLDFGQPTLGDQTDSSRPNLTEMSFVTAAAGESSSSGKYQPITQAQPSTRASQSLRYPRRQASGSNASSGTPSRDEKHQWFDGHGSASSSEEEDDKPLSQIHPQAAAAQDAIRRKASRKAGKVRARGRNPGGGTSWDGEGGVPADVLRRKLQVVEERMLNWQLTQAGPSRQRTISHPTQRPRVEVPVSRSRTKREQPLQPVIEASREVPRTLSRETPRSETAAVSRSSTRSSASKPRSRALSITQKPELRPVEPLPVRQGVKVNAYVDSTSSKRIALELYPETTAKDVLNAAVQRRDITDTGPWTIVEVYAELGYERPVREYESLLSVVNGWDPTNQSNCLVFRQSNSSTSAKSIPSTAPFLGAYVQYETKKGKWSKRFLETRGGQVFVSKNDKNKEEFQINTLFHDIYTTRQYASPKPFVFILKRVERASVFEKPTDHTHIFCAEDSVGFKLVSAVFDAKSYTIAQSQPHLLPARRAIKEPALLDLKEDRGGFTGKGLLRL